MNHKVNSVVNLYDSATTLHKKVVSGPDKSAASILQNLKEGIENLKANWEGSDAGVQINNVVLVYNTMAKIKNMLDEMAVEGSRISSVYRGIQKAAGVAQLEDLPVIREEEPETVMPEYEDKRDIINIQTGAEIGKQKVEAALNEMDGFMENMKKTVEGMLENWTAGPKREEFKQIYEDFYKNIDQYKGKLSETTESVKTALKNYDRFSNINDVK